MKGKSVPEYWDWTIGVEKLPKDRSSRFSIDFRKCDLVCDVSEDLVLRVLYYPTACERYARESTSLISRGFSDEKNIVAVIQQVAKKEVKIVECVLVAILVVDDRRRRSLAQRF